jgi:hypothetical protein
VSKLRFAPGDRFHSGFFTIDIEPLAEAFSQLSYEILVKKLPAEKAFAIMRSAIDKCTFDPPFLDERTLDDLRDACSRKDFKEVKNLYNNIAGQANHVWTNRLIQAGRKVLVNLNRKGKRKVDPDEIRKHMSQLQKDCPEKKYSERVSLTAKHFNVSETLVKHIKTR